MTFDDDTGAPKVVQLSERFHRTRTERRAGCCHVLKVGERYSVTIYLVDGDFEPYTSCLDCHAGQPRRDGSR